MAYNGKFTTFLGVVESAFRDAGVDKIDYESAVEWTAKLIGLLGVPYLLIEKVTNGINGMPQPLEVKDYRVELPSDLEVLQSVRKVEVDENGAVSSFAEMIESSDIFHFTPMQVQSGLSAQFNPVVNIDQFDPKDEDFIHSRNQYEINNNGSYVAIPYMYKLDAGWIYTNFESGLVELSYRGFPIDNNGWPMIPDDEKFREALELYIISKLDWKAWRKNPSPQNKSIANDSEQRALFAIGAARNKAHIPSLDKMESLKNMWLRSIEHVNEHSNGFGTMNIGEKRYNNSSRIRRRR